MSIQAQGQSSARSLLIPGRAAADALSMSLRRLTQLTSIGAVPSVKIGRSRRYCPQQLAEWVRLGCPIEPGAAKRITGGNAR
jgi:hypothetical protein